MEFCNFLVKSIVDLKIMFIFAVEIGEKFGFNDALAYYFALD